ncbi:hypothetical protein MAH1_16770 [Sessilibacter sp. MAH1]|mgnify:CR=1 FL=1
MLNISARNQLTGTVTNVVKGAVNGDVWIDIGNNNTLFANITNDAITDLAIKVGDKLTAIVKSSSIILTATPDLKISARNRLKGKINTIKIGAVNSEISIQLSSNQILTAIVTCETVDDLALYEGSNCTALIKASQIIVAKNI